MLYSKRPRENNSEPSGKRRLVAQNSFLKKPSQDHGVLLPGNVQGQIGDWILCDSVLIVRTVAYKTRPAQILVMEPRQSQRAACIRSSLNMCDGLTRLIGEYDMDGLDFKVTKSIQLPSSGWIQDGLAFSMEHKCIILINDDTGLYTIKTDWTANGNF
jgi:hypothetical protein